MIKETVFVCILMVSTMIATAQTGEIRGTVVDKTTGEPMAGATVVIETLKAGATTGNDGRYALKVAAGRYAVTFMYLAYATVVVEDVSVVAGATVEVNAAMSETSASFEEIVVTAVNKMNSEVSTVNAIRAANAVVSGISAQQIARSQDRDASEAMRRIPGISIIENRFVVARGLAQRYNNVWVNNSAAPSSEADSRAFSFDMIPSSQIENIMIVKSPAPDLPADFTGGFVKIATRNMPSDNSMQFSYGININTMTHFRDFLYADGSATDFAGFDNGLRAMKPVVPARRMDNSDREMVTEVSRNGFNNNWAVNSMRPVADHRAAFTVNRFRRVGNARLGLIAALNYSYAQLAMRDMTNARFGIYNKIDDRPEYFYKYSDNRFNSTAKVGAMLNLTLMTSNAHRVEFRNIFNQQGRDRFSTRDGWQNISARYDQQKDEYFYHSRATYSGQLGGRHDFSEVRRMEWNAGYSYSNKRQPDRRQVDREKDVDRFGVNSVIRDFNRLDENMFSAGVDYSHTFVFGGFKSTVKAGAYAEYRSRRYDTRYFVYKMNTQNLPADFQYYNISDMMRQEWMSADRFFISDAGNRTNDYSGNGFLGSGYLAVNIPAGKFNIYAGARYENSRMSLLNYLTLDTDLADRSEYAMADIFPSVNATFNIDRRQLVRLSFGRTVNRQEFREVSPSTYYDFDLFSFVRGNKTLKPAYVNNFDLRYEIYPASGEVVSIALFYKDFRHPIEWTYIDAGGSYTYTFENAARADSYGVELDVKRSLDFVGLPRLSLSFNGAIISSHVRFDRNSMEHDRPMQGQSPWLVNTGLFYINNNLNVGLMYNIIGQRIAGIGRSDNSSGATIDNNIPDTYEMPRHTFDLSFKYRISKLIELSAGVRDILAQPVVYKQYPEFTDDNGRMQRRDQITKEYRPGQNISFAATIFF